MSFFSFNIIGNAVDTYQEATTVTADNIANVATPGASRQSAIITEAIPISGSPFYSSHLGSPGTRGEGAVVQQIARIHQDSYDGLFRGASGSQNFYTTQQQQLDTLQSNFGEPSNGINFAYAKLQSAISSAPQNLAGSPQATENAILSAAGTFTTALNSASSAITAQEATITSQASGIVAKANGLIDQIASLNGQIRSLEAVGDNPNTYLDQRDYAIDQLSGMIGVTSSLQPNGSTLVSVNGHPIVSDTVTYHLASPVIGTSSNGTPTFVIGMANDPAPSNPQPVPLGSGQLEAFADLYNSKLRPYAQQLDNFAGSAASEINRITQSAVDYTGNPGTSLFTKAAGQTSITAASISVAITDPSALPLGLISTIAGKLTQPMNSANNSVSAAAALTVNADLRNPPAGTLTGTLTVAVDGTTQTFAYNTGAGGNADTISDFMTNFNAGHFGVTATFDPSSKTIGFTRDPNNIDAVHRGKQGSNAATAAFTLTDSNGPLGTTPPAVALGQGTPATGLLQALGATNINGIAQTPNNAFGANDSGAASALTKLFSQTVGVGALQTSAAALSGPGPGYVTITPPVGVPGPFSTLVVGQMLTIVNATTGTQQDVPITAIDYTAGTITVTASAAINVNDPITTAATQTLGAAYQGLITKMGLDVATSTTGVAAQSALTSSIEAARQSVDGINIDEETQNLLKFQSAYTAAAKTLSTLNALMQTTLGLITGG